MRRRSLSEEGQRADLLPLFLPSASRQGRRSLTLYAPVQLRALDPKGLDHLVAPARPDRADLLRLTPCPSSSPSEQTLYLPNYQALPEYRIRVTEPKLCDSSVKQLSGYLDIGDDKHLFFWFFESRNKPKTDPLVLWLNGSWSTRRSSTRPALLLIEASPSHDLRRTRLLFFYWSPL